MSATAVFPRDPVSMTPSVRLTTRRSASLAVHGELKPGPIHVAPKAPLQGGGEASAPGPECFTAACRVSVQALRFLLLGLLISVLAGCAGSLTAKVTTFQQWPSDAAGASYRLSPVKGKANDIEYLAYADMVRAAMGPTGLVEVRPGMPARFAIELAYENPVEQGWARRYADDFYPHGWGFAPYFGGYYGWGGFYVMPRVITVPIEYYRNTLTVFIRDNQQGGKEVYRATAVHEGGQADDLIHVMPYLARAIFDEFPGNNGQLRKVRYELPR